MKNNYTRLSCLALLFGLLISQTLFAQTAPVIQWQKLAGGSVKQAANGDIILGWGSTVSRLNQATGTSMWQTTLPMGFEANIVYDLVIASDGAIVALTKDRTKWSLIKLDANGAIVWSKSFTNATQSNELFQRFITNVIQGKDGNYVVMGYSSFPRAGANTELYLFGTDGTLLKSGGASYSYPNSIRPSSVGDKIIATADGGFLLVGGTDSGAEPSAVGWAAKLDQNLTQIWTDRYNFANNFTDVIPNPFNPAAFIASGTSLDRKGTVTLVISPTQPGVNNTAGTYRPSPSSVTLTPPPNDGATLSRSVDPKIVSGSGSSYEVIDAIDQRSGDIRITSFASNNQTRWTKILGGSLADVATKAIVTSDGGYLLTGLTQSTDGDVQGKTNNSVSGWLVKLVPGSSLTLNQPTYDCSTGAITFNISGGDGSPITYSAPGITRSSATSNTGTVEQGLRNDPKPITITATQSGQTTTYSFDFKAFCSGTAPTPTPPVTPTPPTTGGTLTLTQPTYNCSTGAITFNNTGGDGSTITYSAPGIMRSSATSSTGTVEQGLRNDPKTILITAMQGGQTATYSFDFKAFCSGNPPIPTTPVTPAPPITSGTLSLSAYVGNCASQTPLIAFKTTGGDGTPITFSAPGVVRRFPTDSSGTIETGLRNDPKPITISALQSGKSVSYVVDLAKVCDPTPIVGTPIDNLTLTVGQRVDQTIAQSNFNFYDPYVLTDLTGRYSRASSIRYSSTKLPDSLYAQNFTRGDDATYFRLFGKPATAGVFPITVTATVNGRSVSAPFTITVLPANTPTPTPTPPATENGLTLTAPTYTCSTGAITFNYAGGNGSPVEFQAAGITGWTTNPNQFVDKDSRMANDVKPFTLMARQNGQVVTYTWDLKAACGRSARVAAAEAGQGLQLTVKGNPVGNTAIVDISGVDGQAVQLDLLNASGHVLEQRHIDQAGVVDEQRFELQRLPSGMLFLRAQSGQQRQTVKLIKQ